MPPHFPWASEVGLVERFGGPGHRLILLVGAAGFEPATCSTQNCRATRLRYTPRRTYAVFGYMVRRQPARRPQTRHHTATGASTARNCIQRTALPFLEVSIA